MRSALATTAAITAALLTGCSSNSGNPKTATTTTTAAVGHYASAQAIADKLQAAGFTVSMLHKNDTTAITDMGGTAYDFTVTEKPGRAPGDSGINMFPNHEALATWTALSKSFGGIAVTGDTWAVSLATGGKARTSSLAMAPHIAQVLGGTVQK